jgi:hypothetical protein
MPVWLMLTGLLGFTGVLLRAGSAAFQKRTIL